MSQRLQEGPLLKLFSGAELYDPQPQGEIEVLVDGDRILQIGALDPRRIEAAGLEIEVVDASGCLLVPGLIDPHEHVLGGSGEKGFSSQSPELRLEEIAMAGVTTVVGCLGVDTTTKTMAGLLGRIKALKEHGITAWMWTGGYDMPPKTLLGSVRDDILFVDEIVGVGEIAVSDQRAMDPHADELARVMVDAHNGGMLAKKAGLTHFHVGERKERLALLRKLCEEFAIEPAWLYPTHVQRSEELLREAVELAGRGAAVDIDVVDDDLPRWLALYLELGGDLSRLTVSTDASGTRPGHLWEQLRTCVLDHGHPLERVLPLATRNPAQILQFRDKGVIAVGGSADLLLVTRDGLQIREVMARGQWLVRGGELVAREGWVADSDRQVNIVGEKKRAS
jgi:beta-aspartyl-dipeptidase (metallo-type)